MDDILKLAKDYSKKRHLDLLPHGNNNILENLEFIYDENWENQGVPYPYECFLLGKHTVERVCSGLSPLRRDRLWC